MCFKYFLIILTQHSKNINKTFLKCLNIRLHFTIYSSQTFNKADFLYFEKNHILVFKNFNSPCTILCCSITSLHSVFVDILVCNSTRPYYFSYECHFTLWNIEIFIHSPRPITINSIKGKERIYNIE